MNIVKKSTAVFAFIAIVCMVLFPFAGHLQAKGNAIAFEISPYLSNIATDAVTVNWRLKSKGVSVFKYGITLDYEIDDIRLTDSKFQHSINLENLQPDTRYHYNVNNSFIGSFRTDRLGNRFRFAALGHTHGTERFNHYPDRLLIGKVQSLDPDFIVHMGDSTFYSNNADYKEYLFDEFETLIAKTPMYISPGNHDAGWPFVYGPNITTFKNLFSYPYPKEIKDNSEEAFYSIVKGNMQLLFISYTSPLGEGSLQRQWLKSKLLSSPYDFNVIVYGGAQSAYYDEKSILDFISNFKVDLILNGDGSNFSNKYLRYHRGIPIYFIGTNGGAAHDFLYLEYEGEHISIKRISAIGKMKSTEWIYLKKQQEKKIAIKIDAKNRKIRDQFAIFSADFSEHLSSDSINGLQIRFKPKKGQRAIVYAYITPEDSLNVKNNEGGFRTQYHEFSGDFDSLITLSLPKENPLKGGSFNMKKIRISILAIGGTKVEEIDIQEMYLY